MEEKMVKELNIMVKNKLYEGEYLNGKRNGKGKEYDSFNNKLIYECECFIGKKNGKGKEFYSNGAWWGIF